MRARASIRRGSAVGAGMAAAIAAAFLVPASAANWVDVEYVSTDLGALDCGEPGVVDTQAWGRVLTGTMSGQDLEAVAAIDGITVANFAPATTSSASGGGTHTDLGNDAWSSNIPVSVFGGLDVGNGVTLPFGTGTGSYTQYGRATSAGLSVGASGAVTTGAGGAASLESPGSATPRLATLSLSPLLDPVLAGGGLGTTSQQLGDVELRIGAVGAIASYDSCDVLWDEGTSPGTALTREYLVDDLGLDLTSSRVTELATSVRTALTTLEGTLDAITGPTGTSVTGTALTAVQSTLTSALDLTLAGIAISLGTIDSLRVSADFDLTAARNLVTGTLSDGVVSVNLGTGKVTADLESLFGEAYGSDGLNGLDPNTSVLTAPVLSGLSTRVGALLTSFVTTTIADAITQAINDTVVTVTLSARLNAIVANSLQLSSTFSGTIGGFAGVPGYAAPTANSSVTVVPGLGLVGTTLNGVLGTLTTGIVDAVATNVLPSIGTNVVTPLTTTAVAAGDATVTSLTATTIPAFLTQFGTDLTTLNTLVDVTVNAQPDAPGSVGSPSTAATGRYFETAMHIGVVDASAASIASLFHASASVGPNSLRH